ncbi:MAG TPA: GAF domain-containing protein, partial [Polyangia bacterium]|nr:GAF domain-containing protein [Polyangia bacterium]
MRNPPETDPGAQSEVMLTAADRNRSVLVHERADRSLDGIFRLIEAAGQPRPLAEVLARMCADVSAIAAADVVSVYVRDASDDQVFTMRGNVGFPATSIGNVHLRQGEGITGFVAEKLLPVSVAVADRDEHFKYIPGLGEERFPAMLAVPIVRAGAAAAVLVLQRGSDHEFSGEEVVLATALAAVISHALERAEERERTQRETGRASVRLPGTSLSRGAAMGRAAVLPTLAALARGTVPPPAATISVDVALERLEADVRKLAAGATSAELASLMLILSDRRFRDRLSAAAAGATPLKSMSELAREYARVAFSAAGDEATEALMSERAAEIEDLCVIVHAVTTGQTLLRPGDIVISERLRTFMAAHALARGVSALVVDGTLGEGGAVATLARAASVPLVAGVAGVFAWVHPGDLLVVDADAGSVRVNP